MRARPREKEYERQHFLSCFPLLPPANEVWGKIIFSEACVKNSVHRRGFVVSQHALQVVSEHALQVSRGVSRPTLRGGRGCIPACTEADPPVDGYYRRRYRSYLNAFLFLFRSFSLVLHWICFAFALVCIGR